MSQPSASAWVLDGLLTLRDLGYTVDVGVLNKAAVFVRNWAVNPASTGSGYFTYTPSSTYLYDLQAYVAYLLIRAGFSDPGFASNLYYSYQNILPFARAYLAQAIAQLSGVSDPRVQTLLESILSTVQQYDNQAHWSDKSPDWLMMESDASATSIVLDALMQLDPGTPLTDAALRWIKSRQLDGAWVSTQSTAVTMRALADYAARNQSPGGTSKFSVLVNGKTIGEGTIDDANRGKDHTFVVPLAALAGVARVPVTLEQQGGDRSPIRSHCTPTSRRSTLHR